MGDWKHDDLARDLAAHLRGYARPAMIWLNMQLGPSGSPRPDVYSIEQTYQALRAMAFEIKVSRADFLRDVQAGKYLSYLKFAGAVSFAAPKGLLAKGDIPVGCGLIERGDDSWRWSRKPTINRLESLPVVAWLKLVIDGCGRDQGGPVLVEAREAGTWRQRDQARKLLGKELGQLLADRDNARLRLESERQQAERDLGALGQEREAARLRRQESAAAEVREVRAYVSEVARALGMPDDAPAFQVVGALRKLTPEGRESERKAAAASLRRAISQLEHAAEQLDATSKAPA